MGYILNIDHGFIEIGPKSIFFYIKKRILPKVCTNRPSLSLKNEISRNRVD